MDAAGAEAVGEFRAHPPIGGGFEADTAPSDAGYAAVLPGGAVRQYGAGLHAWPAVLRLVRHGGYDVVVLDTWDRLAASEPDSLGVLGMLDRAGVRVLMVAEGVDTGDPIGRDLVVSLLDPAAPRQPVLV